MRKIAALVVAGLCFLNLTGPILWIAKVNDPTALNKSGDNAGMTAADGYMVPYGFGQMWPGTEAVTMPTYRPGVLWLQARYDSWRVWGVPLEAWPRGVRQFRADSVGVQITDSLTVGGTANIAKTVTLGPGAADLRFTNTGAIRALDIGGTYRRVMGMAASNFIHFWPSVSAGIGLDIRKFDDSDYILRIRDPRAVQAKDLSADSVTATLGFRLPNYPFASLPTHPNGSVVYCTDCSPTNPSSGGGTGRIARRENGAWNSGPSDPTLTTDTLGVIVQAGRPNGQTALGSSATVTGANTFWGVRAYNQTGGSGAAWELANQDWDIHADDFSVSERASTLGLNMSLGSDFSNTTHTGSFRFNPTTTGVPGKAGMVYIDKTGGGATVPNLGMQPQNNQNETSGRAITFRDSSGTEIAYVSPHARASFAEYIDGNAANSVASAATINVPIGNFATISGTAEIDSIGPRPDGSRLQLLFTGTAAGLGVHDNDTTMELNGDFPYTPGSMLSLYRASGVWREDQRSYR